MFAACRGACPGRATRNLRSARSAGSTNMGSSGHAAMASYEGALVRAILLLKYERIEPLGRWFARAPAGSNPRG
jgi:predicted amidophosphoribosyltransferase